MLYGIRLMNLGDETEEYNDVFAQDGVTAICTMIKAYYDEFEIDVARPFKPGFLRYGTAIKNGVRTVIAVEILKVEVREMNKYDPKDKDEDYEFGDHSGV